MQNDADIKKNVEAQLSWEPRLKDDRASIRAKKRGNARGAKGGREVEA